VSIDFTAGWSRAVASSFAMTTPAGWYPNPDDASSLRFWDGEQWTNHTARPARTEGATATTYWQRYLKRWKYTFLIVTVASVVGQVEHPTVDLDHNWISLIAFSATGGAFVATILTLLIARFPSK
jgi:hypothetical protein